MAAERFDGDLKAFVRDVPDFPKPGILFRDLTPLMGHGPAFSACIDGLAEAVTAMRGTVVVGIEARGFVFAAAVAARLGIGFVPIRKPGKLPWKTHQRRYDLEYGTDGVEMHADALAPGARAVIVDDVLATGGTAAAAIALVEHTGAEVAGTLFVLEIAPLDGRKKLGGRPARSLITYG